MYSDKIAQAETLLKIDINLLAQFFRKAIEIKKLSKSVAKTVKFFVFFSKYNHLTFLYRYDILDLVLAIQPSG